MHPRTIKQIQVLRVLKGEPIVKPGDKYRALKSHYAKGIYYLGNFVHRDQICIVTDVIGDDIILSDSFYATLGYYEIYSLVL